MPEQLTLEGELACWASSSPFGDVQCSFSETDSVVTFIDVNPHGNLRGASEVKLELSGFTNRETANATSSFQITTLTEEGFLIDQVTDGLTVASNCDWPCWECPVGQPN